MESLRKVQKRAAGPAAQLPQRGAAPLKPPSGRLACGQNTSPLPKDNGGAK